MNTKFLVVVLFLLSAGALNAQKRSMDQYLTAALDNSPLLKDYQNQIRMNSLDSERIRATYKPQVMGNSNNSYSPVIKDWGYDNAVTNGALASALVGVNKTLISPKYLSAQFETLNIQSKAIQNTQRISAQDLKRTIIAQYITAFGDMQQLNFEKEVLALLKKEDVVLKKLTENNVYRQTDYLTFLVTLQQQELSVRQQSIHFQNDFATLNYLSGITDTTFAELQEPAITPAPLPSPENSVFFYQYTLDSLKLRNERAVLDFTYKPRVNVFADAGFNSSLAMTPYKNFGTSFGFSVTVPIYDGHQRKIQYRKLDISEQTRQSYKNFFISQYSQQILQLMQQLKGIEEQIGEINHQIKYSEGLIQAHLKLLGTGDARIADLVIALNNYMTAKNLLTQNTVSRLQIINQINYWNR